MAIIIGGYETGLLNGSQTILDRNDHTGKGAPGHGEELYVNVANGNLVIQQADAFLPSLGDDYQLIRTYNARGRASDAHQHEDARWTMSTSIRLDVRNDNNGQYFEVEYGDGTVYEYRYDAAKGVYVSTDGAGAFETIEDLGVTGNTDSAYVLTRADQTKLTFSQQGNLTLSEDTNGVRMEYVYKADRLVQVRDDQGHVLDYLYQSGLLHQVVDESEGVLVEYRYDKGLLSEVIDRNGHSTQYFYTNDGFLERMVLPSEQMVDGVLEVYGNRELSFQYTEVNWRGGNKAIAKTVSQITDAQGGITTFDYDFNLPSPSTTSNGVGHTTSTGRGHFNHGDGVTSPDGTTSTDDKFFLGGSTRVVDALGNNRAFSNEQQYQDWRTENGYYAVYNATVAGSNPNYQLQVDAIRGEHSLSYSYDADGYIVEAQDQQGFKTNYTYDEQDNLTSITDRNGWGSVNSDSSYYRQLRAELGYTDLAGNGKLVGDLTAVEQDELREAYTRHFTYDDNGNLLTSEDNSGNDTTFTYTSFNKVASVTSAVGNALVGSDDQMYQDKRVELGFAALVADLTVAERQALHDMHTTTFAYDGNQNLIERVDAGGDLTRYEYDVYGNQSKRIVYLDANDLVDPAKQQVTQYFYDAFGNNIETVYGEGNHTHAEYDHFGNMLRFIDGNGGLTTYTYDSDNRLLTVTDPEGHTTTNTYDAVGNRISVTDANGHTVTRIYSLNNLLIATIDPSISTPAEDRQTTFTYDVVGNNTSVTDAEGRETTYVYNARREVVDVVTTEVAGADGTTTQYLTSYAYDGEGNRVVTNNNRGYITEVIYDQNGLVKQQTDPNGHVTRFVFDANYNQVKIIAGVQLPEAKRQILSFSYDEEDQMVKSTDAEGNSTLHAFDAPGNRIAVTDANGHITDFEYDHNNRMVRETRPEVTDPVTGQPVRYTVDHIYDANGNEIETVDENGHSTRYSFDKDNHLVMVEDANGIKTVYTYDSRHNTTSIQIGVQANLDIDGHVVVVDADAAQVTTFVYDEFNQIVSKTDGVGHALADSDDALYQQMRVDLGYAGLVADLSSADKVALRNLHTEYYSYDRVGNQLVHVDNLRRTTEYQFDALNRLVLRTDANLGTTGYRYDGNGNLVSSTDAEGRVTSYFYDEVDRLTDTTDPMGVVTHREYDDFGNLTSETRAFGVVGQERTTAFEYDLNNRVVRQTDPESHAVSVVYDAVGNRIRTTDARGNAKQYIYDALDRNVKIIDPLTFETQFEYDGVGNRISLIDARGGVTRFEYDPGNRQISTTDAEGRVVAFAYDVRGNRVEMRTAAGTTDEEVTVFEYDAENNLRSVVDAEGYTTSHDYDRVYNRVVTTDGNGHTTITEFDVLDRAVRVTDAEGGVTSFSFDAVGNQLTHTDALNRTTTYAHDDNNRLIVQTTADGVETHYSYDEVSNQTSIVRAANTSDAVTETFTYNLDDQLIAQADGLGNSTVYVYDENHNLTISIDPEGHETAYTYDANNQVIEIRDPEGNVVSYRYDGNGNRTQVIDGRNYLTTTYYNANNEVSISVDAEGYATTYLYDNNGNVVSQTLHAQALVLPVNPESTPVLVSGAGDQTIQFEYDKLNRAVARVDGEGYRREFDYDAVGNRLQTRQYIDLAGTTVATTYSYYDDINREVASVSAEGYLTLAQYDAVGNRTQSTLYDKRVTVPGNGDQPLPVPGDAGRTNTFVYDAVNRLITQTNALGVVTKHEYDDRGNRTALVEAVGTAEQRRTEFTFDAADRLIDTTDALGVVTHNVYDADGSVVARHDAYGTAEARVTTFTYDGNHRMVSTTDAMGVVTNVVYDASGNMTSRTSAVGLPEVRTESFEYDGNNRRVAQVNGESERTEFSYDGAGNLVVTVQAPGLAEERTNSFEYDLDNRLVAQVDGEGVKTKHRYDGADNRLETIEAVGVLGQQRSTTYIYDLDNRLIQATDPLNHATQYTLDVLGNRVETVDANGAVQTSTFDILGRQIGSLSPEGVQITNNYDLRGNVVSSLRSFTDGTDARSSTFSYDLLDRRVSATDGEGFTTTFAYDAFGNKVEDVFGQYLLNVGDVGYDADKAAREFVQTQSATYDAVDRLVSFIDGEGYVTARGYNAVGDMVTLTQAQGFAEERTITYSYDLAHRVIETLTPEGGITRNTFNEVGDLVGESVLQSTSVAGDVWSNRSFEYDDNARLTAMVDSYGVRTENSYDAMGNRVETRQAPGTADERVVRFEYDLDNRITAEVDGEGNRVEHLYDSINNRIRSTDANGGVTRFYFNADNQMTSMLNAEGYLRNYSYDSAGNAVESTLFMTKFSGTAGDFIAPVVAVSAQDRTTTTEFDRNSRAVRTTNPEGGVNSFAYDGVGNRTRSTDALGRDTLYTYDLDNRLTVEQAPDGVETSYTYDAVNNMLSVTAAANTAIASTTTFAYDLENRLVSETDALANVTTYGYDKAGNKTSVTDPEGHQTHQAFDLNNRLVTLTDALGNTTSYSYDRVGNRTQVVDALGYSQTRYYDDNNQVVLTVDAQGYAVSSQYDGNGNRISQTFHANALMLPVDPAVVPQVAPDAGDRTVQTTFDLLDRTTARVDAEGYRTEYSYDAEGNRLTTRQYIDLAGITVAETASFFDVMNREVAAVSAEGYLTLNRYDAIGNRTQTTRYDNQISIPVDGSVPQPVVGDSGRTYSFVFDSVNRLTSQVNALGVETRHEYDARGNRTALIEAAGTAAERSTLYSYDAVNRVVDTTDAHGVVTHNVYDADGNIVARHDAYGTLQARVTAYVYDSIHNLVSETDALGVTTSYVYDAEGNMVSRTSAAGQIEARTEMYEYDGNGRVIAERNGEGERTEYAYDGVGNRVRVTRAPGLTEAQTNTFEFDRDNRLVAEVDGLGVRTTHRYDGADNRIETVEAEGVSGQQRTTTYSYDLDNRLLSNVDPLGHETQYTYDVLGNRTQVIDANGGIQTNTYDLLGRQTASLSAEGVSVSNTYDVRGNIVSTVRSFNDGSDARVSTYTYDLLDRRTSSTDGEGFTTTYTYDVFGNRIAETAGQYLLNVGEAGYDAAKAASTFVQTQAYSYDAVDRLIDSTDGEGHVSHRAYDAVGNMIRFTEAVGQPEQRTTAYSYDLANRRIETVTPEGGITRTTYNEVGDRITESVLQSRSSAGEVWINRSFEYDDNARLTATVDAYGVRTQNSYDAVGNRVQTRQAAGTADERVVRFEYDLDNRVTAEIDGEGGRTEHVYDSMDNRIRTTDANGGITRFYFNGDNQMVSSLDAEGYVRHNTYDSAGNTVESTLFMTRFSAAADDFSAPTVATSSQDRTTTTVFDRNSRAIQITNAEGGVNAFSYDGVGNRTSTTDALGRETLYTYDLDNRLTIEQPADGVETRYTYDAADNRISMVVAANTAQAVTTTYAYDLNNQMVKEVDALGATTAHSYDKAGNRIATTDPLGHTTAYAYDLNNRLSSITDAMGAVTSYGYDLVGNQVRTVDALGNETVSFYDDNSRAIFSVDAEGYATSSQYDGNGNLVSQTLHMNAVTLPVNPAAMPAIVSDAADRTTQFSYDLLDRNTERTDALGYRSVYSYDAVGNRTSSSQYFDLAGTRIATTSSFFDVMDREVAAVSPEGYLTTHDYDAVGNRIRTVGYDVPVTLTVDGTVPVPAIGDAGRISESVFDANNRVVSETNALGIEVHYEYDARGNNTARIEAVGTVDQRRTEFRYDAVNRLVDTTDALGVVSRNVYDLDGNVVTRYEALGTADERVTNYAYDAVHRQISETDALGVATSITYDAIGNLLSQTTAVGQAEQRTEYFEYDNNGRRTAEINGEGERTEYTFDGAGNRISLIQAPGLAEERSNTFEYDLENRTVATVDANGTRTEYRYDGAGNKIETIQAVGLAEQRHSNYEYDLEGRLTKVTDPIGAVTSYVYDALGNQSQVIHPNGGVQTNSFDALGRLLTSTSQGGVLTAHSYDDRGNIIATTQSFADGSDSRTTRYSYDLMDRQVLVTDPEGFSTSITYDAFGNQLAVSNGLYLVDSQSPQYEAAKAAVSAQQSNTFVYDGADRLLRMTDALGTHTDYTYNAVGERISMTEASNVIPRTTTYAYDLAGRRIEVITPEGGITRSVYNNVGNMISEQRLQSDDGFGNQVWTTSSYEYDATDNLTAQIDAYGVRTEYVFDVMGNRTIERQAAGTVDERVSFSEYDLNNREIVTTDAEGNRSEYDYDASGNRIKVTDALGRVGRFYFDLSNQLTSILDPEGYVTSFAYDSAGNQTEIRLYMTRYTGLVNDFNAPVANASALDRITSLTYDGNSNNLTQVDPDGSLTEKRYDAAGSMIQETQYANTGSPRDTQYEYDANNRLVRFTDLDGTVTEFTYDAANNKTSETILSTTDAIASRKTTFEYDLNNRKISEVFDPQGVNFVQTMEYDALGNVVRKTDANGIAREYAYDLNNRVVTDTLDPGDLALVTRYGYDAVGNATSITDPKGYVTTNIYDNNDRLVETRRPAVQIYTVDNGFETITPTVTKAYDAAGNETQSVDANGYVTTSFYDGNNRLVAQLDGYNVLREYTYNAAGNQVTEALYMTRLSDAEHDPSVRPAAPSGEQRVYTREYDLGGRETRVVYPQVTISTLNGAGTNNPSVSASSYQPEETTVYNEFGNAVELIDKNGDRTVRYYDVNNRVIAQVDGAGYLVEWDYDAQGNLVAQRSYATPLSHASVDPGTRPAAPVGAVHTSTWGFNTANQMIEEFAPQITVFDPNTQVASDIRPKTVYTYDANGNQLTKTMGAGTSQATTEYSYYDANNNVVAVINGARTLHLYGYDANGNVTRQERFINTVPVGVDLASLNGDTNFRDLISVDGTQDQTTLYGYNSANQRVSEVALMNTATAADDLVKTHGYDAAGQRTYSRDEDLNVTETKYNALGLVVLTKQPDGSGTITQYDAAGNQTLGFTGSVANGSLPATTFSAALGANLTLSWAMPGDMDSYVVYDTVSRASREGYLGRTGMTASWGKSSSSANINPDNLGYGLGQLTTGETLYYRVVTQDRAGNLSWSSEQSVSVPPRFTELSVTQPSANTMVVTTRFSGGVQSPMLQYGAIGNTNQSVDFVLQTDGSYAATLTGVSNPQELAYRLAWQDSSGLGYTSGQQTFESSTLHTGVISNVAVGSVSGGSSSGYTLHIDTEVPSALASEFSIVNARWRTDGNVNDTFASQALAGVEPTGDTTRKEYSFTLGEGTPLAEGTYEVILEGVDDQGNATLLDHFVYTVDGTSSPTVMQSLAWPAAPIGNGAFAVVDGQRVSAVRPDAASEHMFVDVDLAPGNYPYSIYYTDVMSVDHSLDVLSTEVFDEIPPEVQGEPSTFVSAGFDLGVIVDFDAAEASGINGNVYMAWRSAGSGDDFGNVVTMSATGNSYSTTLGRMNAGQYDVKVYYQDAQGREVIADWYRADTTVAAANQSGASHTVLASESDGNVSLSNAMLLNVDPGLYIGELDVDSLLSGFNLSVTDTGLSGGSLNRDGRDTGYFTTSVYNALDALIADVGTDGLYREYGVDANGNAVETRLYGREGAPLESTSYAAYDARNRMTAKFDAAFTPNGETTARHPVTRMGYDLFDNKVLETDPRGYSKEWAYNALGSMTSQTNIMASGDRQSESHHYDVMGRETAITDALGNRVLKYYDQAGRLVNEVDGAGRGTSYTYDAFDRRQSVTNGLNQTVNYDYDQADNMTRLIDGRGKIQKFDYDGRGNRISTTDQNGHVFTQEYDALSRVTKTTTYQNGTAIHEYRNYDFYGNIVSETDGAGRVKSTVYGGFSRLAENVDEGGARTAFEYDDLGRMVREYDIGGAKDIRKFYDDAGQLIRIEDRATGVTTTYRYDIAGNRVYENTTTPSNAHNRTYNYSYNERGELVRWHDSVTGVHLNYIYDAAGNLQRTYTDVGYNPDGVSDPASNYRHTDHWYNYDGSGKVTTITNGVGGDLIESYSYDSAGNRKTWNDGGNIVTYTYDANGRVTTGTWTESGQTKEYRWSYDDVGNVTAFRIYSDGTEVEYTTYQYYENNKQWYSYNWTSEDGKNVTTYTMDDSGLTTRMVMATDSSTITYNYSYYADTRESSVSAYGDKVSGSSTTSYDANENKLAINKGKDNDKDRAEVSTFVYNNEGKILHKYHDDGESSTREEIEYLYANGNAVGESGTDVDGVKKTLLDVGNYSLLENLGEDTPGSSFTFYTANTGDTLQSVATALFGNPSLWFVIAEANGMSGSESLKAGMQLQVPNNIKSGRLTSEAHALYKESDIIGSSLPNLKSEGGGGGSSCAMFVMIVAMVVIAVVAPYAIGALAGVMAGTLGTIGAYIVAGAVVGALASIATQGVMIALGFQESFDWGQVGAGALAGAFTGAAQGIAKAAELAQLAGNVAKYAKVASAALQVAGKAIEQYAKDGKITSWTSLVAAGIGAYGATAKAAKDVSDTFATVQKVADYATPWVQLAETAVRNDGKLAPADWASAIGSTLSKAVTVEGQDPFVNAMNRTAVNAVVAGALSSFDKEAGKSYLINSVGTEVGQMIGGYLGSMLPSFESVASKDALKPRAQEPKGANALAATDDEDDMTSPSGRVLSSDGNGGFVDANGNPVELPGMLASSGGTMTDGVLTPEEEMLMGNLGQDVGVDTTQPMTHTIESGDSFWNIAKGQLGPDATDAQVLALTQQLMEVNPGLDPRTLQIGQEINLALGSEIVSPATVDAYNQSDAEYQDFLEQKSTLNVDGSTTPVQAAGTADATTGVTKAAPQLSELERAKQYAILAADVYNDTGAPEGFVRLNDNPELLKEKFGIDPDIFTDKSGSGFAAALYQNEQDGSIVLAFRGTEFESVDDWLNNIQQGAGYDSAQYEQAIKVAQNIQNVLGDDFSITGHSLGGGLASAAAVVTNTSAVTFNAAGVNPATLEAYGVTRDDAHGLVTAYQVQGEVLTGLQESTTADLLALSTTPTKYALELGVEVGSWLTGTDNEMNLSPNWVYSAIGDTKQLPAIGVDGSEMGFFERTGNTVDLHSMDAVLRGIDAQQPLITATTPQATVEEQKVSPLSGPGADTASNRNYIGRGKDGRIYQNDVNTGRFAKSVLSPDRLAETVKQNTDVNLEVTLAKVGGSKTFFEVKTGQDDVFGDGSLVVAGPHAAANGTAEAKFAVDKSGVFAEGKLGGDAEIRYGEATAKGALGKLDLTVGSVAEANVALKATVRTGGPIGVKGEVAGKGEIGAALIKGEAKYQAPEASFFDGIVNVKAGIKAEGHLVGIGASAEAGVKTLESKVGVKAFVGAGLTALVGGKLKGEVEISINTDRLGAKINEITNATENFIDDISRTYETAQDYWWR